MNQEMQDISDVGSPPALNFLVKLHAAQMRLIKF